MGAAPWPRAKGAVSTIINAANPAKAAIPLTVLSDLCTSGLLAKFSYPLYIRPSASYSQTKNEAARSTDGMELLGSIAEPWGVCNRSSAVWPAPGGPREPLLHAAVNIERLLHFTMDVLAPGRDPAPAPAVDRLPH